MNTQHERYLKALGRVPVDPKIFSYVGVIGGASREAKHEAVNAHDIDVVLLPNQENGNQFGRFHTESYQLLDRADEEFRSLGGNVTSRAPMKHMQAVTSHLVGKETSQKPVDIHTLFFFDRDGFYKLNPQKFLETALENNTPVYGNLASAVKGLKAAESPELIFAHTMLANYNVAQTAGRFPSELTREQTSELIRYFSKWYGAKASTTPKSPEDCKRTVLELIAGMDGARC